MFARKLGLLIISILFCNIASAHGGGLDLKVIQEYTDSEGTIYTDYQESVWARFDIAPDDIGKPGALALVLQGMDGSISLLTPTGWKGFKDGMGEPLLETDSLNSSYEKAVFDSISLAVTSVTPKGVLLQRGRIAESSICGLMQKYNLTGGRLYAAYGALQPDAVQRIESLKGKTKISLQHYKMVFIDLDGRRGHKYSEIVSFPCDDANQNGYGGGN
jgi:hypothetical protein